MKLEFALNKKTKGPYYVGYAPVFCSLKITDGQAGADPLQINLTNISNTGGQLVFYQSPNSQELSELTLNLPADGAAVSFYIGGKYKAASTKDGDAGIDFKINSQSQLKVKMMVRVRKDANDLSPDERDRFLNAFVTLLEQNKYNTFLDMHSEAADAEIHGRPSFLPWHRLFVLDLERHLQEIDASVTVPYWDFQKAADKVFSPDFMGIPLPTSSTGRLQFNDNNPLNRWQIGTLPLLSRRPRFDTKHDKARVENKSLTMSRGPGFFNFSAMEIDPHGYAHTSFFNPAPITNPATAPQDPLFFMLHCNIDRLWAEWQLANQSDELFDADQKNAYDSTPIFQGQTARIGDFVDDTLWPWNGVKGNGTVANPRPATAPGGPMIPSAFSDYPGKQPTIRDTIDYQGRLTGKNLCFDYDTVPYAVPTVLAADGHEIALEKSLKINSLSIKMKDSQLKQTAFLHNFNSSQDFSETLQSLSNLIMITDKEGIKKATALLKDKTNDAGARVLALSRLVGAVSLDAELILYLLEILKDQTTPIDLRRECLRTLETISFNSTVLASLKPEMIDTYRGLMKDPDQQIRQEVISYLAKFKDEYAQRELLNGLEHPNEALVPEDLAINLLGNDIHAGIFPVLRNIVQKSSNNESRAEAIHLLSGDPESKDLLLEVFNNKKERFNIRKTTLMALKQQNPEEFALLTQQVAADDQENESIRVLSINAIDDHTFNDQQTKDDFIHQMKEISINTAVPAALSQGIKTFLKKAKKNK